MQNQLSEHSEQLKYGSLFSDNVQRALVLMFFFIINHDWAIVFHAIISYFTCILVNNYVASCYVPVPLLNSNLFKGGKLEEFQVTCLIELYAKVAMC